MINQPAETTGDGVELPGMPAPLELCSETVGESVVVSYGGRMLACYDRGDRGMRNLAIVALTRAGVKGVEVARLFGVRPERVYWLCRQAAEGGSRALLPVMGRPVKLDRCGVARAYEMADRGLKGCEIAREFGVSEATISRTLARRPAREGDRLGAVQMDQIGTGAANAPAGTPGGVDTVQMALLIDPADGAADQVVDRADEVVGPIDAGERIAVAAASDGVGECGESAARIGEGGGRSVYAGAMLLHPFLAKVGAGEVLSVLDSGPARRYDTSAVALAGTFAFALGSSSLEGSKHLLLADAGLLVGSERFPHLRTLRPRLGALADRVDPLAVQVALSKAMLDSDPEPPSVFFVDEHFVAYTGSRPVSKGWNTRRRHAEPGRHETVVVDDRWRAVCFSSGPPQSLRPPVVASEAARLAGRSL